MFEIRKILVPVDFSACSRSALEHALALAAKVGAQVEVLHVAELPEFADRLPSLHLASGQVASINELAADISRKDLEKFLAGVPSAGRERLNVRVEIGKVQERILAQAKLGQCDLIVLGTNGRTGRAHSLAGSVAESVVRTSSCPVLTVRAAE